MGKKGPRSGSRSYWHRGRASGMVPRIRAWATTGKGLAGFAGYKAGMTSVLMVDDSTSPFANQEVVTPATVIEVPPLFIYGIVAYGNTAYGLKAIGEAVSANAPKELSRTITVAKKPKGTLEALLQKQGIVALRVLAATQPVKAGFKKTPETMEIALAGNLQEQMEAAKNIFGKEVKASDVFKAGEFVDAIAVTTGQGWQGVVTRMGVSLNPRKATGMRRHGGSIGGERQAKIMYTIPRAGQHGFHRRTDGNKRVLMVADAKALPKEFHSYGKIKSDFVMVKGSVPGPSKRLVRLRKTFSRRAGAVKEPQVKLI